MAIVANALNSAHPVLPDTGKARMAKAVVRIPDIDWNEEIGAAIQRAVLRVWPSNKVAAAEIGVDDAEFGKWLSGGRRAQFDKLWAIERFRQPLVTELAALAGAAVEVTVKFQKVG